ncbi:MAG: hypothetical protein MN733_17715 [Nitrososphaera sp.]|nr:hypothetical protein [Nitrososphaera sp.]
MNNALITKSPDGVGLKLYDDSLNLLESDSFADLSTMNFLLQTVAKKHKITSILLVVHYDVLNQVGLSIAHDEDSIFVS